MDTRETGAKHTDQTPDKLFEDACHFALDAPVFLKIDFVFSKICIFFLCQLYASARAMQFFLPFSVKLLNLSPPP